MKNLIKKVQRNEKRNIAKFKAHLEAFTLQELMRDNYAMSFCTPAKKELESWTKNTFSAYLISRYVKKQTALTKTMLQNIANVSQAPEFNEMTLTIKWKKRSYSPTVSANVWTSEGVEVVDAGRIGGGGYCKESAGVARVLNKSISITHLIYKESNKGKNYKLAASDIFPYAVNGDTLPYFAGGCGMECFPEIFEMLGLSFERIFRDDDLRIFKIAPLKTK